MKTLKVNISKRRNSVNEYSIRSNGNVLFRRYSYCWSIYYHDNEIITEYCNIVGDGSWYISITDSGKEVYFESSWDGILVDTRK